MSTAVKDTTKLANMQASLLSFLRNKTNLTALMNSYALELQAAEDALWQVNTLRDLNSATGLQLDNIGDTLVLPRSGFSDSDYRTQLRAKILLNIASGLRDEIQSLFQFLVSAGQTVKIADYFPAEFFVTIGGTVGTTTTVAVTLGALLAQSVPAGVYAQLIYSTTDDAHTFQFASGDVSETDNNAGFGAGPVGQFWTLYSSGAGTGISAVGNDGGLNFYAYPGGGSFIRQSTDGGVTWAQGTVPIAIWSSLAVYDGGLWGGVLIGTTGDGVSVDGSVVGTNGATASFVGASAAFFGTVASIAVGGGKIVVCGSDGVIGFFNGTTWADKSGNGGTAFNACALTTNDYVVVGAGTACRWSTDGNTWNLSNTGLANANTVAFGATLFVAGDAAGNIATSPTGQTWTGRTSNFGAFSITKIAFLNSLFVAIGANGKLCTSPDGITWTARTSQFGSSAINDIAYSNGQYIIVGASGKVATSTDGLTWTLQTSNIATVLNSIAANASTAAVAAGTASQNVITSKPDLIGGMFADAGV